MIYCIIIGAIFGGELFLKDSIERSRKEGEDTPIFGGHVLLRNHHNKGACLNFCRVGQKTAAAAAVFFTILMLGVFLATMFTRGNAFLKTGLALLLGGAFSNTYDRLYRKYVVDYFSPVTRFPALNNIIFNLSDFCIAIGAAMTAVVAVFKG